MEKYDTFLRRFVAGLIDGLVLLPVSLLGYFIKASDNLFTLATGLIFIYSSFYIYTVYFHWSTGQTLGKKWMGVRVIDKSEQKLLTFKQSFMRDSIYILFEMAGLIVLMVNIISLGHFSDEHSMIEDYFDWLATLWFLLEVITMLTNERRRALHDIIAGSVVIREEFWNNRNEMNAR